MEVTAEEAMLIRLLRMRTDGDIVLSRNLLGVYQASVRIYGHQTFSVADRLDPVSALVEALGPVPGQSIDDLARVAAAQTPKFDIANTSRAVIEKELDIAKRAGRPPPQAVLDIMTAKKREDYVGEVKPRPLAKPVVKRNDLEDIL